MLAAVCRRRPLPPLTFLSSIHTPAAATTMESRVKDIEERVEELVLPTHHRVTKPAWFGGAPRFSNPWPTWEDRSFSDLWRWSKERRKTGIPSTGYLSYNKTPTQTDFAAAFPSVTPDAEALASPPSDAVQATWVGHATVLVQIGSLAFLTDPVFAKRCSPISFLGPARVVPPALDAASLPHIDALLISHNHYDHLCSSSIASIAERFGRDLAVFVPLGLGDWFRRRRFTNVTELDWWEEAECVGGGAASKATVTLTPAQHWSRRGLADQQNTLWGGFAVKSNGLSFYFAGDTGYCPVFTEIGEKLGPFDLAALPTGAYEPRWFMKSQHCSPSEAVRMHNDIKSRRSFAIHLATFPLTDEPMDEPVALLEREAEAAGLEKDAFVTLRHGAHIVTACGELKNEPAIMSVPTAPHNEG